MSGRKFDWRVAKDVRRWHAARLEGVVKNRGIKNVRKMPKEKAKT